MSVTRGQCDFRPTVTFPATRHHRLAEWLERCSLGRGTFPILHQTASWMSDHFVVKPSAIGQPTWPTQPSIPQGSVNE